MRIVYFDIDSLRPDHLGCYGYNRPTSPTIDAIARDGIRFNNYYCASSPCVPARACHMSGRFGIHNGVLSNHGAASQFRIEHGNYRGPAYANDMFPRVLKRHGYDPVCFSNFADRHYAMWFMCGWSEFHTPNLKGGEETGDEVNACVLPWLEQNATRDSYYLHINYWDAHRNYRTDPSWLERFKDTPVTRAWPDDEAIKAQQSLNGPFTPRQLFNNGKSRIMPDAIESRADLERLIDGYDASIACVDHHIKQVLDELDRQGVLDETMIVISSDHGESFGEHGIYAAHVDADECVHHIPLIVRYPGMTPRNSESNVFMYNVDFAPTVCDMLDMPIPEHWDGKSYRADLEGKPGEDRDYLVWDTALYAVQRAVRTRSHLYMRTYDAGQHTHFADEGLYDMTTDPYQVRNIASDNPDVVTRCRQHLEEWVSQQTAKPNWISDPLEDRLRSRGQRPAPTGRTPQAGMPEALS